MQIINKIFCTLRPSFRHIISVWDNMDDTKKILSSLTARLLKEKTRSKAYKEQASEASNSAFLSKKFHQTSSAGRERRLCNFCGKRNHWEGQCLRKKKMMGEGRSSANLAQYHYPLDRPADEGPVDYTFTSLSFTSKMAGRQATDWYLDSGASQHMSDQYQLIINY